MELNPNSKDFFNTHNAIMKKWEKQRGQLGTVPIKNLEIDQNGTKVLLNKHDTKIKIPEMFNDKFNS